jgi:hypothetical protein
VILGKELPKGEGEELISHSLGIVEAVEESFNSVSLFPRGVKVVDDCRRFSSGIG